MDRVNQRTNHLLGYNIRRLRIKNGLRNKDVVTQLQIRGIEISTGTYSKVELGLNNPSVDMLIALTDIFSCDYNAFFQMPDNTDKKQLN
ncbi:MAG TPA: helix-turn-helix domain-containing protein [Candidatus Mediterraneibacter guildfordensis]|nr:helix-turn-helix domain-containing protein [Candidatus Mediterraneibacter guildfordensis]